MTKTAGYASLFSSLKRLAAALSVVHRSYFQYKDKDNTSACPDMQDLLGQLQPQQY